MLMQARIRLILGLLLGIVCLCPATGRAQATFGMINSPANWWRKCASLDLDFINDRYYVNSNTSCDGTVGTSYSGIANFITGIGGTFTRAGTNVTTSGVAPFYLANNQSFVSRASVTNNVTSTAPPFYEDAGDSFVSRASVTNNITSTAPPFYEDAGESFVSRGSTATYFNSSGVLSTAAINTARTNYTYNGSSWVNAGTLIEPAATNLLTYSQNIASGWSTVNGATVNATAVSAPDGTSTGGKIMRAAAATSYRIQQTATITSGTTYTLSVYAQAGELNWLFLVDSNTSNVYAYFNLSSGTVGSTGGGGSMTTNISNVGNGWYRCSITYVAGSTTAGIWLSLASANGTTNLAGGNTTDGLYVWGAQLEANPTATSYYPTTSSSATRSADVFNQQPATYFDSTGTLQYAAANTARTNYTYNGSSWVNSGTLIEPAATNLLTPSADLSGWTQQNGTPSSTANANTAPDGTNSAATLTDSGGVGPSYFFYQISPTAASGSSFTFSVYLKTLSGTGGFISFAGLSQLSSSTGVTSTALSNGWTRYSITGTTNTINAKVYPQITVQTNSSMAAWGAQLEQSTYATSYMPTGGSSVTRTADVFNQQPATYFDSTGTLQYAAANTARTNYTYNGSSWVSAGTLTEPAATNLITYSNSLSAGDNGSVVANAATAPDGTLTAYQFVENTANGAHDISSNSVSVSNGVTISGSMFVKAGARTWAAVLVYNGANWVGGYVNLSTGAAGSQSSPAPTSMTITPLNGWYLVSITTTMAATSNAAVRAYTATGNNGDSYTGDGASGLYAWGAQLEQSAYSTSYIPTNGSTVTRTADVYLTPVAGTYFDNTGTMQTAAANTPRMDHDPVTGAAKGVLIEEGRTNYLYPSSTFSSAPWGNGGGFTSITANSATAPDGTNTATLLTPSGGAGGYISQTPGTSMASHTVTRSIYAKRGTGTYIFFEFSDSTNCGGFCVSTFNLNAATASWNGVKTGEGGVTIQSLSNGWYRLAASFTYSAAGSEDMVTYVDSGYGGSAGTMYLWGAQLEVGPNPTSYIATSGSTVTRAKDVLSIPVGTWFNSTTGTFLADSYGQLNAQQNGYGRIVGGTSDLSYVGLGAGYTQMNVYNDYSGPTIGFTTAISPSNSVRFASAWDTGANQWSIAAQGATNLDVTLGGSNMSTTTIYIGESLLYDPLNASIKRVTFFPIRLPDSSLVQFTQ